MALNGGRHLYSAMRPSRWALAHIVVLNYFNNNVYSSIIIIIIIIIIDNMLTALLIDAAVGLRVCVTDVTR